ncbi:helix-turn-helix domain-containing protein [Streptomyces inhibens]|uniref:helix-turn-helix domain-containing protein n=1 Tax=Streptomyces inhibens TaxID=2293571 RepID=UPI0036BD4A72
MYRLCVTELRKVAAAAGDRTAYAIHKRVGISESSAYRIFSGESQPDLNSMLLIGETYGVTVESLVERVEVERVELAEAAA